MSHYDFDEILERHGTCSLKYDQLKDRFGVEDILPMWVADMDFRLPDFISTALKNRIDQGVLGYSFKPKSCDEALIDWWANHHDWKINPDWIIDAPGVVPSLSFIIQAYSQPGAEIIVQPPVYYPFFSIVKNNHRQLISNPLVEDNGRYKMNPSALAEQLNKNTAMVVLCNPHNPGGKVWDKEDLELLVQMCMENDVLIISDEIHADLVFPGKKHVPVASLSTEAEAITITCISASKTFNIAGLGASSIIIPNTKLRKVLQQFMQQLHLGTLDVMAYTAVEAAYSKGQEWHGELMLYLQSNLNYLLDFFEKQIPDIVPMIPEATYLVWLNCRKLQFDNDELKRFMVEKAKLAINDGPLFGKEGEGFQRMNIALPKNVLKNGLSRLKNAVDNGDAR